MNKLITLTESNIETIYKDLKKFFKEAHEMTYQTVYTDTFKEAKNLINIYDEAWLGVCKDGQHLISMRYIEKLGPMNEIIKLGSCVNNYVPCVSIPSHSIWVGQQMIIDDNILFIKQETKPQCSDYFDIIRVNSSSLLYSPPDFYLEVIKGLEEHDEAMREEDKWMRDAMEY